MNKFYMRLFGKPEFLKNNKAIKLSRLEWATVIYLYLFKRQSRAELADSIWKSRKARDNLRQQIAVLHEKGIPIKKILDSIELEEIETDCDTLLKLAQAKQYLAALDLIRGEFLYQVEDFVDLEGFQTSIKSERSNRKLEVFNLFFPAMDNLRSSGKLLDCQKICENLIKLFTDDEQIFSFYIDVLQKLGNSTEATRVYNIYLNNNLHSILPNDRVEVTYNSFQYVSTNPINQTKTIQVYARKCFRIQPPRYNIFQVILGVSGVGKTAFLTNISNTLPQRRKAIWFQQGNTLTSTILGASSESVILIEDLDLCDTVWSEILPSITQSKQIEIFATLSTNKAHLLQEEPFLTLANQGKMSVVTIPELSFGEICGFVEMLLRKQNLQFAELLYVATLGNFRKICDWINRTPLLSWKNNEYSVKGEVTQQHFIDSLNPYKSLLEIPTWQLLEVASAFSSSCSFYQLGILLGKSTTEIEKIAETAIGIGIVVLNKNNLTYVHQRFKDTIYQQIASPEETHQKIAKLLKDSENSVEIKIEIARHLHLAKQNLDAIDWYEQAARDFTELKNFEAAVSSYQQACDLATSNKVKFRLQRKKSEVYYKNNDLHGFENSILAMEQLRNKISEPEYNYEHMVYQGKLHYLRGEYFEAIEIYKTLILPQVFEPEVAFFAALQHCKSLLELANRCNDPQMLETALTIIELAQSKYGSFHPVILGDSFLVLCELLKNLQRQFNPLEVIIKAEKAYKRANDREGELRAMILRINIQSKSDTNSDLLVAYGEVTKILEENMGFELRVRFLILACKLSINLDLIPQNSIQYADELYGYFVVEEPKKHEEDWVACLYLVQYFFEISNYIKTAKVIPMLSTRTEPYIVALIKGYLPKLPKLEIESISPI